jgi:hypothetical protein
MSQDNESAIIKEEPQLYTFKRLCESHLIYKFIVDIAKTRPRFDLKLVEKLYPENYRLSGKNKQ